MPTPQSRILTRHFFRRFFDNDTLSIEGETETTVIRALSFCAVPGLMFAFWLLPSYPGRSLWTTEADRYFFVLFSFVAMGVVATFEWEMLFPDRTDFLILLPLPLQAHELFYAKARALLTFLGLFLVASNLFSSVLFPAVSTRGNGSYCHAVWAHLAAVLLSGICAAFTLLAVEGLVLCLLPSSWFRRISTVLQALSVAVLVFLFLLYPLVATHLEPLMQGQSIAQTRLAGWIPPLWFLGLDETLLLGTHAPAGAWRLATTGLFATGAVTLLAGITYPLAWSRQKKRAIEGTSQARRNRTSFLATSLEKTILRQPQQRAIFHFLTQTIARNPRYQIYLALYAGLGLAFALCTTITVTQSADHAWTPTLWQPGLHAVLPLLLFWMVAGLRGSFAFPVDMGARWIFPISLGLAPTTPEAAPYAFPGPAAKSAKTWVFLCCLVLTGLMLGLLLALHWSYSALLIQAIAGAALSLLLADLFFLGRTQIPFTRPRLPGRTNLAIVFTLYAVVFPVTVLLTVRWEVQAEARLTFLLWTILGTAVLHFLLTAVDTLATRGIIGGFPEDETDQGPQTLGLFQ
jgi:hypothetical protein